MKTIDRFRAGITAAVIIGTIVAIPCFAASIPAWLDDAISKWNSAHPESPIRYVNIKDSFVWYDLPKTSEVGLPQVRERVHQIALDHGYKPMDDEEKVTTGKPPVTSGPVVPKKCWSRSFVLNVQAQEETKAVGGEASGQRQRMLTSLVCEDTSNWWAAFRVAE